MLKVLYYGTGQTAGTVTGNILIVEPDATLILKLAKVADGEVTVPFNLVTVNDADGERVLPEEEIVTAAEF